METSAIEFRFVGREPELAGLFDALEEARAGRIAAVLVGGETGMGKTRLVAEAVRRVEGEMVVLGAQALDVAELPPLWPVIDALGRFFERPDNRWALDAIAPWRGPLSRVLPGTAVSAPTSDEDLGSATSGEDLPLVDLLGRVLASLAAVRPVVLVLDDLQWADRSTRDFLVYTLASTLDCALALLVTYRTGASGRNDPLLPLLPELRRNRRVRAIDLGPLDERAIGELVEAASGSRAPRLEARVWRRSEGSPFIAEQTLRSLVVGSVDDVPATLRQMVLGRVEGLPGTSALVLRAVAAAGEPVDHDLLAAVVALDPGELLVAIRASVEASLIDVDPDTESYSFHHGLFQEVIVTEVLPGERRHLHRRFAEALGALPGASDPRLASRIAHHWDRAHEWSKALTATLDAAVYAQSIHGYAEATRQWARAVELLDLAGPESVAFDPGGILEDAAESAALAGEHDLAVSLMRRRLDLKPSGDIVNAARRRQRLAHYLAAAGNAKEALGEHEEAINLTAESPDIALRADVLGGYAEALLLTGHYASAREESQRAVALAEEADADPERSRALTTLGYSLAYLADPSAGVAALERALEIADLGGSAQDLGRAYVRLAELLAGPLNRLDEAVEVARTGASRVAGVGLERTFGVELRSLGANALFRLGRWSEADAELNAALATKPTGSAAIDLRLAKARLLVGWGEIEEAEEELEALDLLCADSVGPRYRVPVLTLRAGLALWQGDSASACAAVAAGLRLTTPETDDIWLLAPLVWHGLRAVADDAEHLPLMLAANDGARERQIDHQGEYELLFVEHMHILMERASTAPSALTESIEAYLELCAGERDRARGRPEPSTWERAAQLWERNGHPYPTAYCWYRHADALLRRRSRSAEGFAALRRSHALARRLGARPLVAEITALAGRARVDLEESAVGPTNGTTAHLETETALPGARAAITTGVFAALTERELAVLAELADGRTNKEIAGRLFISDKTVSAHLSHIFEKLGVHTRVQATSLWHRAQASAS